MKGKDKDKDKDSGLLFLFDRVQPNPAHLTRLVSRKWRALMASTYVALCRPKRAPSRLSFAHSPNYSCTPSSRDSRQRYCSGFVPPAAPPRAHAPPPLLPPFHRSFLTPSTRLLHAAWPDHDIDMGNGDTMSASQLNAALSSAGGLLPPLAADGGGEGFSGPQQVLAALVSRRFKVSFCFLILSTRVWCGGLGR